MAGHDAQIEAAVGILMKEIAGKPAGLPAAPPLVPAYPASGIVAPQPEGAPSR